MINELFNYILQLKNIKKEKLIIDNTDTRIMECYYEDVKDIVKFKLWKKIVIDYSITTTKDVLDSCVDLVYELQKKYKK